MGYLFRTTVLGPRLNECSRNKVPELRFLTHLEPSRFVSSVKVLDERLGLVLVRAFLWGKGTIGLAWRLYVRV